MKNNNNNKIILILLFTSIIITGCNNKSIFTVNFDNFYLDFATNNIFSINDTHIEGLTNDLLKDNILDIYTQTQTTGYKDSIIIIKKTTTESLEDIVEKNNNKIQIEGYETNNLNTETINCNSNKIKTITTSSLIKENLHDIFFVQTFFVYDGNEYIISFSSEDEDEHKGFVDNIKKIKCNK